MLYTVINSFGIAVFAISGALLGVRKRLDFFGIWLLSTLTGVGGGILRDILLGITPPYSVQNWQPLLGTTAASILVYLFHPRISKLSKLILFFDSIGVSVFSASAVFTALNHHASNFAAIFVALVTAIGGGLLRDIIVNEVPLLLSEDFYAVPIILGSITTVISNVFINSVGDQNISMLFGVTTTLILRLLGVIYHWRLPGAPEQGFKKKLFKL